MDIINMPGFTAEDSLYRTSGHYRSDRNRHAINLPAQTISTIHPTAAMVGEEVIEVFGEAPQAPWGLPWGWGPGGWSGGSGGGGTPGGPTDGGGGGGGGTVPKPPKPPKPPASSCGYPPLHCGGPAANRGVYPGCDVTCGPGETSMCLPGSCFWRRGPICTCLGATTYSPLDPPSVDPRRRKQA